MDRFISEIIGFLLTVVMMVGLFLTGLLWYNINQYNSFKNQAQQVVERAGGLSSSAQTALDKLSMTYYHGHFQVWPGRSTSPTKAINLKGSNADSQIQEASETSDSNRSVGYGGTSEFMIYSNIPLSLANNGNNDIMFNHNGNGFFGTNMFKSTNPVSVVSQVREGSQQNIDLAPHGYDTSFTRTNCDVGREQQSNTNCNNDNQSTTVKNHKGTSVVTPHND